MTYSIVATDPDTGALGVAVQSHWFSVGSVVSWARAGVGAVATQSLAEPAYGPKALDLLAGGATAPAALAALVAGDESADVRQVAVVDAAGRIGVHTGAGCIPIAEHVSGDGWSCQANMMAPAGVPDAMAAAFTTSAGPSFARRLLAALVAAEAAGGDVRGRQSAALLVVPAAGEPWQRTVDVRVEDHAEPLDELARLLTLAEAYDLAGRGDDLVAEGRTVDAGAMYEAAQALAPGNAELRFWAALAAADRGDVDGAAAVIAELARAHDGWRVLLERLPASIAPSAAAVRERMG